MAAVQVINASRYSIKTASGYEMAHQVEYSNETIFRAIVSPDGWIRIEGKHIGKDWIAQKPYIVRKDKKRQGERIIEMVQNFLN